MDIFFIIKKAKIIKAFLRDTKDHKNFYQLQIKEYSKTFKNVYLFENRFENFSTFSFSKDLDYRITGRVINLFGNKQILSVSKIIPLCENNKLGSEESHLKPMGVKN